MKRRRGRQYIRMTSEKGTRYRKRKRFLSGFSVLGLGVFFLLAVISISQLKPLFASEKDTDQDAETLVNGEFEDSEKDFNSISFAEPESGQNDVLPEDENSISFRSVWNETPLLDSKILDAPYISQVGHYPTGCESVSAVMAMQYAGIDISVDTFIDRYLDTGEEPWTDSDGRMHGGDPWETFLGDPREASGWGCYAPVIRNDIEKIIDKSRFQTEEMYGLSLEELCKRYLNHDIPVVLWATIDMETPTLGDAWTISHSGETLQWVRPEHCLLLVGYDQEYYYFNDPMTGKAWPYDKKACEAAYEGLHSQAVVVYPWSED